MAYDDKPTRHFLGARDFGTASSILAYLSGPKGKSGLLYDYGISSVVEAFTATTLHPGMQVGTVADEDAYGDLVRFTSMAIADGSNSIRKITTPDTALWDTYMVNRNIPADTVVMVTIEEGTGGGDTGQAEPWVDIIWDK